MVITSCSNIEPSSAQIWSDSDGAWQPVRVRGLGAPSSWELFWECKFWQLLLWCLDLKGGARRGRAPGTCRHCHAPVTSLLANQTREIGLVANEGPLRCVISRNVRTRDISHTEIANYQSSMKNYHCIQPWQWRVVNTMVGWTLGRRLVLIIN